MLPPCCRRISIAQGKTGDRGMTFHRPWVCLGARLAAIAVTALLCACAGERDLPAEPSFYASLATKDAHVDAAMAASMISGYRTNNGLTAVTPDPHIMKLAAAQAPADEGPHTPKPD